jgi:hypothetical protein
MFERFTDEIDQHPHSPDKAYFAQRFNGRFDLRSFP